MQGMSSSLGVARRKDLIDDCTGESVEGVAVCVNMVGKWWMSEGKGRRWSVVVVGRESCLDKYVCEVNLKRR
jgi:hypothetical protein